MSPHWWDGELNLISVTLYILVSGMGVSEYLGRWIVSSLGLHTRAPKHLLLFIEIGVFLNPRNLPQAG